MQSRSVPLLMVTCAVIVGSLACHNEAGGRSSDPEPTPQKTEQHCTAPLAGERFSVCGHLTTVLQSSPGLASPSLLGAVDATTPQGASQRFNISGGTFHAGR